MPLHGIECPAASFHLHLEVGGWRLDAGDAPEARHCNVGFVIVLLKELPLENLGALETVLGQVVGALGEVERDRVRLPERSPVVKDERGHPHRRVLISDDLRAIRAIDHAQLDRKSTRLNSSHPSISYAVFCLKKKIKQLTCASAQTVMLPRYARRTATLPSGTSTLRTPVPPFSPNTITLSPAPPSFIAFTVRP